MSYHILIPAILIRPFIRLMRYLKDWGRLVVRLWVSKIFLESALTKIAYWPGTIVIFKYQYSVPFISSVAAAYIGTAAEFIFPILLILGLGGRLSIFAFFVYNVICVISFHFLWTPSGAVGLADHVNWGMLLFMLMLFGPGRISLDHLIHKRYGYLTRTSSWEEAKSQFHFRKKKQKE